MPGLGFDPGDAGESQWGRFLTELAAALDFAEAERDTGEETPAQRLVLELARSTAKRAWLRDQLDEHRDGDGRARLAAQLDITQSQLIAIGEYASGVDQRLRLARTKAVRETSGRADHPARPPRRHIRPVALRRLRRRALAACLGPDGPPEERGYPGAP